MRTRTLLAAAIVACAFLWGSSALATKLAVVSQTKPDADLATPASELAKPSDDVAKPTSDITKPSVDVVKPGRDRVKPVFETPMRELKPMPVSNRTFEDGPKRTNEKPASLQKK